MISSEFSINKLVLKSAYLRVIGNGWHPAGLGIRKKTLRHLADRKLITCFFFLATSKTILNLDLDTLHDLNV